MLGRYNLKLLIKSVEDNEIGTIISMKECDTKFPMVSCTKKCSDNNMEQLTFLLNTSCITDIGKLSEKIKTILKMNNVKGYILNVSNEKISIILDKDLALSILKQIHDNFILI